MPAAAINRLFRPVAKLYALPTPGDAENPGRAEKTGWRP